MRRHPLPLVLLGAFGLIAIMTGLLAQDAKKAPAEKTKTPPLQEVKKAPAENTKRAPAAPAEKAISADEKQIREAVVAFVEQYNAHKAEEVAKLFATDARMTFADGEQVNGRDEIKGSFEDAFEQSPKVAVSVVVDSIRMLKPEVAIEEGTTSIFPDGETLASKGRYTVMHVKTDGRWQMQAVRVEKEETLSSYAQLQPLEWLIGEWIDEGRTENIEAKFHWDENKSFLLEDFQVVKEGVVVLKGTQRIGWDPQAKQVRSWVFDSAGGFGEGVWSRDGDEWICKAKGVSADGTTSTATRTLIRATKDRIIWSATDRTSGDDRLPNLDATMVRKAPQSAK
jgi:uncharacterized protein (TIGR02246 family)